MKITIPTTTFFSEETVNGITNTVMLISRHLINMGHDVSVVAPLQHSLPKEESIEGIKVKRVPTS
ncbi:MAG: hypothetical protein HY513_01990, partial [Candidatus Aenigmarchaeota archaeon]|nr:hypothetical protein [Candidatus Aenigmarchaeota archaeon]